MGEDKLYPFSLLFLLKKALDRLLEKGIAISAAAVKRDNKYQHIYKFSDWDSRCESCMKGEDDETNEREGQRD